jgi:hypothetical protein
MAGLVPAIHVFLAIVATGVDARDKPGHDGAKLYGDCAARCPAVVPAILPNTEPFISPVPPG